LLTGSTTIITTIITITTTLELRSPLKATGLSRKRCRAHAPQAQFHRGARAW
jgi:hypothetical protein